MLTGRAGPCRKEGGSSRAWEAIPGVRTCSGERTGGPKRHLDLAEGICSCITLARFYFLLIYCLVYFCKMQQLPVLVSISASVLIGILLGYMLSMHMVQELTGSRQERLNLFELLLD